MDQEVFINAVQAFERMFQCSLCFHDYTGRLDSAVLPMIHINPYCSTVKKYASYYEPECVLFDQTSVQMEILKCSGPVLKKCPAGLAEYVFPIKMENKLCGVLFAGPFSCRNGLDDKQVLCSKENFSKNIKFPKMPPALPDNPESFLAFGCMLAAMLSLISSGNNVHPGNMKDLIGDFINRGFRSNIGLADVAELLSLTPARASNRVKKEFGKGFSALLKERRLEEACSLLVKTSFSIENIAVRSGFRNGAYFHRVFHRDQGMTPQKYREKHQHYDV